MTAEAGDTAPPSFLAGGGAVGAMMRSHDWSRSPLGHPETWPQSLRSVVGLLLGSRIPMFVAWGPELGFLYNDAYADILGRKHPAALGGRFQDIWAEIWGAISPLIALAMKGEATYHENLPLVMNRKGFDEQTWFTFSYSPVRDESAAIVGMYCAVTETTGQVLAQAALQESEARFRFLDGLTALTQSLTDASAIMSAAARHLGEHLGASVCAYADMEPDQDAFTIRGNWTAPGAASIVGTYSLAAFGETAVRNLRAGQPLVTRDALVELGPREAAQFLALGLKATICIPLVKEGRLIALMAAHAAEPRDWTAGEIALTAATTDRSWAHIERVRTEAALRESESQLADERLRLLTLIENLPIGVCFLSPQGDTLLSNPAFHRYLPDGRIPSHSRQAASRWRAWDERGAIIPPAQFPGARALRGEASELEVLHHRPNGTETWTRVTGVPLKDADGQVIAGLVVIVDIDEQKRAQELLERRVAERTADLQRTQDVLRQSQKMEAMGQLTGGVAHDFNNLLTPIVGSLDMLQRRSLGGERERRLIEGAMQSAERAKTLVQRLLAFARRQPLQPVPVDIAKLVTGMGDLVASTTGPQIKVVVDAPEDLPAARADLNQLEMALLNLSVNARDAMPVGGTLRISATSETIAAPHPSQLPAGSYVKLSVADTGEGMDEATLVRAVEPFFSTKGIGKGTGLGLSMVHGLASQLGGALTIQSRPGLGTNVELWLPQSDGAPDSPDATAEPVPSPAEHGTALLVDDEEFVRLTTADMLDDLGYAVVEATSAEEALKLIERGSRVDIVITDHLMPGMNGTDLARALRELRPGLPILLVSGYAEIEGVDPSLPRLTKPFRKDELAESLVLLVSP